MARDLLQIGLEHHRGGRVGQAEAAYRALLDVDPGNPDAMHWLGVLLNQAGRPDRAISLLEQAAAMRPRNAAFQHNLGCAYANAGSFDDAIKALNRAIVEDPTNGQSLMALGAALFARRRPADVASADGVESAGDPVGGHGNAHGDERRGGGSTDATSADDRAQGPRGDAVGDLDSAIAAFAGAHAAGIDSNDLHRQWAAALVAAGRLADAIGHCQKAIELKSDDLDSHHLMALAHNTLGQPDVAKIALRKSLDIDPGFARAYHGLAVIEAQAGNLEAAEKLLRKAIKARPEDPAHHQTLAQVLKAAGRQHEALLASAQAVRSAHAARQSPSSHSRQDDSLPPTTSEVADMQRRLTPTPAGEAFHYALAWRWRLSPPAAVPSQSVIELFNRYAGHFDEHLRGPLGYRVPEMIGQTVAALPRSSPLDILDLGCGTGLCGPLLRPMARTLVGVDLAPAMIEKAAARNVYDRLETGDLVQLLSRSARQFDLLAAADVFVYIGDLAPTFEAASIALRPGGAFIFSIEAAAGDRYVLGASGRYQHSKPYIDRLAGMFGYTELSSAKIAVRLEADKPLPGYLILLQTVG